MRMRVCVCVDGVRRFMQNPSRYGLAGAYVPPKPVPLSGPFPSFHFVWCACDNNNNQLNSGTAIIRMAVTDVDITIGKVSTTLVSSSLQPPHFSILDGVGVCGQRPQSNT